MVPVFIHIWEETSSSELTWAMFNNREKVRNHTSFIADIESSRFLSHYAPEFTHTTAHQMANCFLRCGGAIEYARRVLVVCFSVQWRWLATRRTSAHFITQHILDPALLDCDINNRHIPTVGCEHGRPLCHKDVRVTPASEQNPLSCALADALSYGACAVDPPSATIAHC